MQQMNLMELKMTEHECFNVNLRGFFLKCIMLIFEMNDCFNLSLTLSQL